MKRITSGWLLLLALAIPFARLSAQDTSLAQIRPFAGISNPSNILQQGDNVVILFESQLNNAIDTAFMEGAYPRLVKDLEMISREFDLHGPVMRIRTLDDVKAKLLQQKIQIEKWRSTLLKQNNLLSSNFYAIEKIKTDSSWQVLRKDSTLGAIYREEIQMLDSNIARIETQYQEVMKGTVQEENRLNTTYFTISTLLMRVEKELSQRNAALFHRTHAPLWEIRPSTYEEGIGQVFTATLMQNLESLKFYGKNAYIRVILFRILLLVITLLPIWYFRKNKKKYASNNSDHPYKFVHKYTGASTSSFVLVMAPLIFVNSPHIFTEVIFVTLAITTATIFLKENPSVKKKWMFTLLAIYVILRAMNLMVSVTFFGRIIWASSIIGILPLYKIYKNINRSRLENRLLFQVIMGLTALLYVTGWILNITGHYPLGRILLLAGLDQYFLAIILYVAIFSLIDFIAILADMYNERNRVTIIRIDLIYNKLLNLVRVLGILFWFISFLRNINAMEFIRHNLSTLFSQQFNIGGYNYAPGSIIIFFIVLYLAFYISGMLDGLFLDEKRSEDAGNKTSLGSIVILLRLFIIALGFLGGMLIAGIPLNNLNLFMGALGVGIGFGLQSFIANIISGVIIAFEKPVYVGDIIEMEGGTRGKVTDIGLRATTVDTADGAEYVIPNNEMIGKVLKNWTLTSKHFKLEIDLLMDHDNDPNLILSIAKQVLQDTPGIFTQPSPSARMVDIAPNGLEFRISCWISSISDANRMKNNLLTALHSELLKAGAKFPKPAPGK